MSKPDSTSGVIEHFFRHEYARIVSHMVKKFGTEHFDLVEDCVQEALLKASRLWAFKGVPDNPTAWLTSVSSNALIDSLRKIKRESEKINNFSNTHLQHESNNEVLLEDQLNDDLLNMMFACCHPAIPAESQIILSLKILSGFGNTEIAKALLKSDDAVAKAYTRAKSKLKKEGVVPSIPFGSELNTRLEVILRIIYLIFNEGYNSTIGDQILKQDLCYEAMRLTKLLIDHPRLNQPQVNAVMAMMCFHASRFDSRQDEKGRLLTLEQQDRSKWNHDLIDQGGYFLEKSIRFGDISTYYLEARIAACHIIAKDYESTDWSQILNLYDKLIELKPNKFTELNRIVAFSKVHDSQTALTLLGSLSDALNKHYLYHTVKGTLLQDCDEYEMALVSYENALRLTQNEQEKEHLRSKISIVTSI